VKNGKGYFVIDMKVELAWFYVSDHPTSQFDSQWASPKCMWYDLIILLEACASCG